MRYQTCMLAWDPSKFEKKDVQTPGSQGQDLMGRKGRATKSEEGEGGPLARLFPTEAKLGCSAVTGAPVTKRERVCVKAGRLYDRQGLGCFPVWGCLNVLEITWVAFRYGGV